VIDREVVNAILQKRFPDARPRDVAAAVNAIVGLSSTNGYQREGVMIALKQILVATDFGEASATALAYGRELARRFGSILHVLRVVDDVGVRLASASGLPYDTTRLQADLDEAERRQLEQLLTEEDRRELQVKLVQVVSSAPAREIVDYATTAHIDLAILGTHGRGGMAHLFLGSVAERVVRTAPCPVLTVRTQEREFIGPDALQISSVARR
jgi:nucleotide-binding universal stress UspA family protein